MPDPHTHASLQRVNAMKLTSSKNHRAFMRTLAHARRVEAAAAAGNLYYDMAALEHCDAGFALLLSRIAREYRVLGAEPRRKATREWMKFIGILHKRPEDFLKRRADTHPLRILRDDNDSELTTELLLLQKVLQAHGTLSASFVYRFGTVLSEVIHNSFVHGGEMARKRGVLLCGQNHRKSRHVIVAATDWGATIPGTLSASKTYAGRAKTDEDWIELAVQPGVTAQTLPTNAGSGLPLIIRIVTAVGGCVHVVSGAGVFTAEQQQTYKAPIPHGGRLAGTLIVAELR